jgi:hypothetical protein
MSEHRLVTLFGSDGVPARDWAPQVGDAGHVIFPVEGSRDAMDQLESQLPRVIAHTEHTVDSLTIFRGADPQQGQYCITRGKTTVFVLPYGGRVLALDLTFDADTLGGCVQIMRDVAFRKRRNLISGQSLNSIVDTAVEKCCLPPAPFSIGRYYELFYACDRSFLSPDGRLPDQRRRLLRSLSPISPDELSDDIDMRVVNVIVNHDLAPHRRGYSRVRFPQAANQTQDVVAALTSSTAVFAGHGPDIINGFILAAVQCVASADRARLVRNDAYLALVHSGILRDQTAVGRKAAERKPHSELADNLGRLELELSFAVEAYLDVGLVLPDERLSAFQRELGAAMAIPEAALACANMLSRLAAGVEASRIQVEKREREEEQKKSAKLTWATSLVAAVAVPLTLVFGLLGSNIDELKRQPSWHDGSLFPYYGLILLVLVITVVIGITMGSRRSSQNGSDGSDKLLS